MWLCSHSILIYIYIVHQLLFVQFIIGGHHTRSLEEKRPLHIPHCGNHVPTGVSLSCNHLVSCGRKSKLLFKLGKRRAEALMTSVGFGVTRLRTCCFRIKKSISISKFKVVAPTRVPEQKQDVYSYNNLYIG